MNLVGKRKLSAFGRRHADAQSQLAAWVLEVEDAQWLSPLDIKTRYPHASILAGNRVIFNIRGNNYRLAVEIDYETQTVLIA